MTTTTKALHRATRAYTRPNLRIYDAVTMRLLARPVWRCHAQHFVDQYAALVSPSHAEVGVGTGYCLDRCGANIDRLALFDLNPNCLEFASRRLARFEPSMHRWNVLDPVRGGVGPFSSVALGGLLHCLPGSMQEKGRVFDNLQRISCDDSVVFGYTLVSDSEAAGTPARMVRAFLNAAGVINNTIDTSEGLKRELDARFGFTTLDRVGAFAFFTAGNGQAASRSINGRQ